MSRVFPCALLVLALGSPGGTAWAQAEVAALVGQAFVVRSGAPERVLLCGDRVHPGDRLRTGPGALLGLAAGDVYAQLAGDSALRAAPNSGWALERGAVRVLDARATPDAPVGLSVAALRAQVRGGDAHAFALAEKAGGYARVCEFDRPLALQHGEQSLTLPPGACAQADPRDGLARDADPPRRLALDGLDSCPGGPVALGPAAAQLQPDPTSLPPVGAGDGFFSAWPDPAATTPPRDACDDPGSGCSAPPGLLPVVDPPPVVSFCPPGAACP